MNDLISRSALKADLVASNDKLWKIYRSLTHEVDKQICAGQIASFQEVILRVKDAPTIEAEPVRHGRWVAHHQTSNNLCECSVCGERVLWGVLNYYNYCSCCGAKMDGGGEK